MNWESKLLDKGYRKWVSESNNVFKSTNTLFQKRLRDHKGTRYFINAWWYPAETINGHEILEAVQFEAQFQDSEQNAVMDVTLFEKDVDKAEEMLDSMWKRLEFGYYELDEVLE